MAATLTTIDQLVESIQHSYVAANKLILQTSKGRTDSAQAPAEPDAALHQQAQFIIKSALGKPPIAIPLALFQSPVRYYLSALHFDLPCYTMSCARFFKWRQRAVSVVVLHSFTPTLWQKMFCVCCIYRITVDIESGQTQVSFHAVEETALPAKNMKRPSARRAWAFRLTPEQEQQLLALPQTIAKPIYWRSRFMQAWRWLHGKLNKA